MLEHITCGTTSITAPIDNVEEIVCNLSTVNPKTYKTGFEQQFEVCWHCINPCILIVSH